MKVEMSATASGPHSANVVEFIAAVRKCHSWKNVASLLYSDTNRNDGGLRPSWVAPSKTCDIEGDRLCCKHRPGRDHMQT